MIYLAGPMRGYKNFNFPLFIRAEIEAAQGVDGVRKDYVKSRSLLTGATVEWCRDGRSARSNRRLPGNTSCPYDIRRFMNLKEKSVSIRRHTA